MGALEFCLPYMGISLTYYLCLLLSIPPGEGNGNPLQYSCLENSIDRGAWWVTLHGVTELDTTERLAHSLFHIPLAFKSTSSFVFP